MKFCVTITTLFFLLLFTSFSKISAIKATKDCNKILDFYKVNGPFFKDLDVEFNKPLQLVNNNSLLFKNYDDLGTLYFNETGLNISNFIYETSGFSHELKLSYIGVYEISINKNVIYYLITYNLDNFIGSNGEMLGLLVNPKRKTVKTITYVSLGDIHSIGDANKNGKLDIITINHGDDNYLINNSTYEFTLLEFGDGNELLPINKGIATYKESGLYVDTCIYTFIK